MKLFTAAALAVLLSSGMAYAQAQDDTTTGSTTTEQQRESGGNDASNYLTGPNIHRFYQNEQMEELRSEAEMKSVWDAMSDTDRESLRTACVSNQDARFNDLCVAVGTM